MARRPADFESAASASPPSGPAQLLSGLDLETGEIGFGAWSDPEGHAARGIAEFEIIHNQTGLAAAVDIQAGLCPFDSDAVAGPDARLEVHVTLILFWCLLAGVREAEIWIRTILRGMIAADLVIGAAVGRTQVDVLELAVPKTEGDSNKAARGAGGASRGTPPPIPPPPPNLEKSCFSHHLILTHRPLAIVPAPYPPPSQRLHRRQ